MDKKKKKPKKPSKAHIKKTIAALQELKEAVMKS